MAMPVPLYNKYLLLLGGQAKLKLRREEQDRMFREVSITHTFKLFL